MAQIFEKWYRDESAPDAANLICESVRKILSDLSGRRLDDRLYLDIMNNKDPSGNDGVTEGEQLLSAPAVDGRVRFNLIRSCVNTLRAHVGATDLSVKCVTDGAMWSQIRRAKLFELFVGSIAEDNNLKDLMKEVFTDAATVPIGVLKVFGEDGRIRIERVHPEEILVDVDEGYYGRPRTIYQVKNMSREELLEMFPDREEAIERGDKGSLSEAFSWLPGWTLGEDRIQVVEAWRLPFRKDGKYSGGKHTMVTTAGVLMSEEYVIPTFPFVVYRWEKRSFGFYGMSIAEDLRLAHETVRYFDIRVQDALYNVSRVKIMCEENSNIETLDDDPSNVYEYKAGMKPPMVFAPSVVPMELLQLRENSIKEGREQLGINDMMIQGEKPAGVTAAVAMRELQDVYSQRFKDKIQEIEKVYIEVARQIIRTAIWMDEMGELKPVRAKVSKGRLTEVKKIKFKDVSMDDEEYWLQMTPASSLPKSSAGRTQTVRDWLDTGLIDMNEARQLLGFPDLDSYTNFRLAAYHEALDKIEEIIEDGVYTTPEATDDLALQHKLGIQAYNYYRRLGVEPERLELLVRMANESLDMLTTASASMQGGQPTAGSMMTAQSQNLQQVPQGQPPQLPPAQPAQQQIPQQQPQMAPPAPQIG